MFRLRIGCLRDGRATIGTTLLWACPANKSTKNAALPPQSPFLTRRDARIGSTEPVHGNRSYVLFCDGHVRWVSVNMMPERLSKSSSYDAQEKRWYNYANVGPKAYGKTIAITP